MSTSTLNHVNIADKRYHKFMRSSNLLVAARKQSGLSQVELSRRSGIAQSVISAYERGQREPGADVFIRILGLLGMSIAMQPRRATKVASLPDSRLARLLMRHRNEVIEISKECGARNIRVFGSVARGDTKGRSDIDLLVDLDQRVGLIEMISLSQQLSDLLDVKVDLTPASSVKARLRERILSEAVSL